jgi:hypothetical protein
VNPILRAPVELATNNQWFNSRPIESYEGEQKNIPFGGAFEGLTGIPSPQIDKRGISYLLDQIPLLRNLDAISDPTNVRQIPKASTFIGGPGIYNKEAVQTSAQYEELQRLQDLLRLIREKQERGDII